MRGNVNDSKRVSPYDLGGIAKLSGKPVSLTDSLSHSRRTPKELLERIASLESQLAEAKVDLSNTREAWNECENTLAEARARLAGYEVGYDPKVQMPEFVDGYGWVLARMCEGQNPSMYHYSKFADTWSDVNYNSYPTSKIYCWFPLPGSKEDE